MILIDTHQAECNCSYCFSPPHGHPKKHYGLNIPKCKAWNSWWVVKYWPGRYIRWTFSFLPRIKS